MQRPQPLHCSRSSTIGIRPVCGLISVPSEMQCLVQTSMQRPQPLQYSGKTKGLGRSRHGVVVTGGLLAKAGAGGAPRHPAPTSKTVAPNRILWICMSSFLFSEYSAPLRSTEDAAMLSRSSQYAIRALAYLAMREARPVGARPVRSRPNSTSRRRSSPRSSRPSPSRGSSRASAAATGGSAWRATPNGSRSSTSSRRSTSSARAGSACSGRRSARTRPPAPCTTPGSTRSTRSATACRRRA